MKLLYALINFHYFYQQNLFRPFSTVHHFYLSWPQDEGLHCAFTTAWDPLVSRTALILKGKSIHSKQSGRFTTPIPFPFFGHWTSRLVLLKGTENNNRSTAGFAISQKLISMGRKKYLQDVWLTSTKENTCCWAGKGYCPFWVVLNHHA